MTAAAVLQAAVVAALRDDPALAVLTAVFDAPPTRSAVPHAIVDDPVTVDWSTKDWRGHEARLVVVLHDAGERPVRLRALSGAVEDCVLGIAPELGGGWRLASLVPVRSRIVRGGGERWSAASEFRVRIWRAV